MPISMCDAEYKYVIDNFQKNVAKIHLDRKSRLNLI